jgi:hypothetical protein
MKLHFILQTFFLCVHKYDIRVGTFVIEKEFQK